MRWSSPIPRPCCCSRLRIRRQARARRGPGRAASPRGWLCTAPRSIRLPGCSPSSSASASRRPSSGCGPTRMLMRGGCPIWPATSFRGACGCILTQLRARMARRESVHADARWPVVLPVDERVSGMDGVLLSATFVELTDTLVAGFDVIDFLHVLTDRSVQLLDVSAAGLLLADPRGELRVVAASSEAARLLELFQLQNDQGPCLDCFRSGRPVAAADLAAAATQWPRFAPAARQAGFAAVQALPMRLREQVIGALNLFRADPGALAPADIRVGQALADVATISLLHERSMRHSDTVNEQLQTALNSRVIIEQAKGKLAERLGVDTDQAFSLLRDRARTSNRLLSDLARAFVDGTETLTGLNASKTRQRLPADRQPRQ